MKRHRSQAALVAIVIMLCVLLSSCKQITQVDRVETTEQTTENKAEPLIPIVKYEQIVKDNNVSTQLTAVVIGDYLIYTDMISYDKPSNLVAMNLNTKEKKKLYHALKGISQIQPVDAHTLALGIPKYVEYEYIEYEYYYFSLDDGSVHKFSENPINRKDADFSDPVWVNGYMVYEIAENEMGSCGRLHDMGLVYSVYCKTPDGVTVPIAVDIETYRVEGEKIYYTLYNSAVVRVCDLDGTDGKDYYLNTNNNKEGMPETEKCYTVGKYNVLAKDKSVFIKDTESGKSVKPDIYEGDIYLRGYDDESVYLIDYCEETTFYRVMLADGSAKTIISKAVFDVTVLKDFIMFTLLAPDNGEKFYEYDLYMAKKDGTGLERLN